MINLVVTEGHTQVLIPLRVTPCDHHAQPTVTGSALSDEAGTVLYGYYNMEYRLPKDDKLCLIANHNKKTVQLMLFTHDEAILKRLPGQRPASLVADTLNTLQGYCLRCASYAQPLTPAQEEKLEITRHCMNALNALLGTERNIKAQNAPQQEYLRRQVISILELCQDKNRLIANNPVISEGSLGAILYDAKKAAQQHIFNRIHSASPQDQMDFSSKITHNNKPTPCFVWDSELHIGHNSKSLDDALRVISQHYQLTPAYALNHTPANRFDQLMVFFRQLGRDTKDWFNYLGLKTKPTHRRHTKTRTDGVSITKITPYYQLQGLKQQGYSRLNEIALQLIEHGVELPSVNHVKEARQKLAQSPDGHWLVIPRKNKIMVRIENELITLRYFIEEGLFYPLPDTQDLYTLSQVSKRHLYWPERVRLKFAAFISRIPSFFQGFFKSLQKFVVHDLHEEFFNHVHANHNQGGRTTKLTHPLNSKNNHTTSIHDLLVNQGVLKNGQSLHAFIKEQIRQSPYVIARSNHPPSPRDYDNPIHRTLGLLRHVAGFFVETSERNPIIGTLAMAAYFFGAGAVLAPQALESILVKLHLNGLISGIEPVQHLAQWISHGQTSEAISASMTLWQGVVAGGNLDKFFVSAIGVLKDDPAEIAIIAALALSLGFGLTRMIPSLGNEMGAFPLPNYAALGGKGGAAIYDTIMHPGDDWLLGTFKWVCKWVIALGKLTIAPVVEGYYYGYKEGFISGLGKSAVLLKALVKQFVAASLDVFLQLLSIPLLEISSMLLHVPFRGTTYLFSKTLGTLGALGGFLDPSIETFFSSSAKHITLASNWISQGASQIKQPLLSLIAIQRRFLYFWAFEEEDLLTHYVLTDQDYYISHPLRMEKMPHSSSHCLLNSLLNKDHSPQSLPLDEENHFSNPFSSTESIPLNLQNEALGSRIIEYK